MTDMTQQIELPVNEYLPLRDIVFQTLRQAILEGKLQPGERLMEIHLAKQLGVSRTPVREAIRKLELDGLVNMIPRRGAVVAEIAGKDLTDVLEVRAALEELAMRKACENMTAEDHKKLREAADNFRRCVQGNDLSASAQADVNFHEVISNATGNQRLIALLSNLREQMYRYRLENLKDKETYPELMRQHEQICKALEAHDADRAISVLEEHIEGQRNSIMEHLHTVSEL